jgi:hypothetical protein
MYVNSHRLIDILYIHTVPRTQHTVMKFSTEFDQVVLELLRRDPRISVLILYSPSQLLWWQR